MLRFVLLAAGVAVGASCIDAPTALDATPPPQPPAGTAQVGVTVDGVGRARLQIDDTFGFAVGNGVVGVRARLTKDGGNTFFDTLPREKVAMGHTIVVNDLDPGASFQVLFVAVTNVGVASVAAGDLAPVLVQVDVPAAPVDVDAPAPVDTLAVFSGDGGVALRWTETSADVFRSEVQRSCDGGGFDTVGVVDGSATPGFFDVGAAGQCLWHVIAEDLSGNRSAVSNEAAMEVL